MADTQDYKVEIEGFMLGTWRSKRTTVSLTEKQAKPFLREGRIVAVAPKADTKRATKAKA